MEWSDHVDATMATWIIKYLHPAEAAWKKVLDHMLFRDESSNTILGGERDLLMCPLQRAEKYKLLHQLPKKATYIRECLLAHWKMGIKQDQSHITEHNGLGAENLWHNARFRITCNGRVRWYFVNIINITQLSDIIDYETGEPFTPERWGLWFIQYQRDHAGTTPSRKEISDRLTQIQDIINQIPPWILAELKEPATFTSALSSIIGARGHRL